MPRKGFNINEFKSQITSGFQRNNKFFVRFIAPPVMRTPSLINTVNKMEFWCDGARIPGVAMGVHPVLRYGYGAMERKPFAPLFTEITMTFLQDGAGDIWTLFYEWMRQINNFDFSRSIARSNINSGVYELNYKDDYATPIEITTFNEGGEISNRIIMREAYPIYMGEVGYNWADPNITRLPITFTSADWYKVTLDPPTAPPTSI